MVKKERARTGAAYFGNRHLAHAERDLAVIAECCDYVVHTMSETDFFYHKVALGRIFEATRKRGLEAWADPWGVGGVFGGEAMSKYLLDRPDEWQRLSDGRRAPAACLNRQTFRAFVREWVLTARDAGAQVVFWDEPHVAFHWNRELEGVYACTCDACAALFAARHGGRMPAKLDAAAREFRRHTLREFLAEAMTFAARHGLRNALCLYAFEGYDDYDKTWSELAALKPLDVFGCDPYWRWQPFRINAMLSPKTRAQRAPADYVRYFSERVVREASPKGKGSQIWLQAMRLPKGTEKEIGEACRAAAETGVTHIAAWSYDGGALLDPVLAEDPAKVWSEVSKAFNKIRSS